MILTYEEGDFKAKDGTILWTYMTETKGKKFPLPRIGTVLKTMAHTGLMRWREKELCEVLLDGLISKKYNAMGRAQFTDAVRTDLDARLSEWGAKSQERKQEFFQAVRDDDRTRHDVQALADFKTTLGLKPGGALDLMVGRLDPNYAGQLDALFNDEEGALVAVDITLKSPYSDNLFITETDRLRALALSLALPHATNYKDIPDAAACLRIDPQTGEYKFAIVYDGKQEARKLAGLIHSVADLYRWCQKNREQREEEKPAEVAQ